MRSTLAMFVEIGLHEGTDGDDLESLSVCAIDGGLGECVGEVPSS